MQSQEHGCPADVSSCIPDCVVGHKDGLFWWWSPSPCRFFQSPESGTEYTWLLLDTFLPKHIGFKDISRRSVWISGPSDHGPHGAGGNEGKLQTVQAESGKRQAVKRNTEIFPRRLLNE